MLKKSTPFNFGEMQKHAFQQLKDLLSQYPVLHIFQQGTKLELHTSSHGFGAVLLQESSNGKLNPIHYMSKKTTFNKKTKLFIDDPNKWFHHVPAVQRTLNRTTHRSTQKNPFDLLIGVSIKCKEDTQILQILEEEYQSPFQEQQEQMLEQAKEDILKIQEENYRTFSRKRKPPHTYVVAIQLTQFRTGLKLRPRFFGPYKIVSVKPNERYDVQKIESHQGLNFTSSAADHLKL
ncbi:hypothetical protein AVEN_265819-1 [Araneus ventricosus]|uniref:Reverse transcriptase/retrotransposon-derived protein RNase H-like domain-containing protein n=1 Tax=Araneus ventricosus TaxID=182803 RepID=A0A4Y2DYW2_ARAVE|nr:hypothetical protein AVEN_265819-1 [Araneus ventricosus]